MKDYGIDAFLRRYETDTREMTVRGRKFTFLVPLTIDRFIDDDDIIHNFPLWAKIWKASWVLADHLAGMPIEKETAILEIGSGIGVAGIVAFTFGHQITLTEYDTHAIDFAHANARLNRCGGMKIEKLDWWKPKLESQYNMIVGSEVLYSERDFDALLQLFTNYLKPGGQVILAMKPRQSAMEFFNRARGDYDVSMKKVEMKSDEGATTVFVCRMMPKS